MSAEGLIGQLFGERRRVVTPSGSTLSGRTMRAPTSSEPPSFRVAPVPASAHHRHQTSLEGIMSIEGTPGSSEVKTSEPQPLEPAQRDRATHIFNQIVNHCEPLQPEDGPYKRITLVRVTYEYALSQDNFLRYFFLDMERDLDFSEALSLFADFDSWDIQRKNELASRLCAFADFLVGNFFLPLKASAKKTPQPTPATLSEIQLSLNPSTRRVATLRRDCLIRDRYRCVISRAFDWNEGLRRIELDRDNAKDDNGNLLKDEDKRAETLEVAHILPHSLMSYNAGGQTELSDSKKAALKILDMFDPGVVRLIDGPDIDRPTNAITSTAHYHQRFGDFDIYFEPTTETPHTYKIISVQSHNLFRDPILPVTRTLYLTDNHIIDPPSPRLLAIHRAIALILHLSAAGGYINDILRDLDELDVKTDGSTELGRLIELRLGGWWNGVVRVY